MNCSQAGGQLAALHDGELDGAAATALRVHVAVCADCRAELAELAQLGRDIRAQAPRHGAPAALRERVRAALAAAEAGAATSPAPAAITTAPRYRAQRRWFAAGALAGALLAVALGAATLAFVQRQANDEVALEAVDNHVRATLADHLVAVVSSDRHTVKPWLSARLDYSAPVFELPESGFVLAGARIDSLDRRPVATLVYRYGNHVVDVFVRPLAPGATGPRLDTVRGFNVARAVGAAMEWRAVADVDPAVLVPFVERLAAAGSPTPR
jgi:anti-sigma factor RsiW